MKRCITLVLLLCSLVTAQEVRNLHGLEGFIYLENFIKRIANCNGAIAEMYKLFLRAEAIDNKYKDQHFSNYKELDHANMEIDSIITLVKRLTLPDLPSDIEKVYSSTQTALLSYCTSTRNSFSQELTKTNIQETLQTKLDKLLAYKDFFTNLVHMKEQSRSRYIHHIGMANQYLLPPKKRIYTFGILETLRPEQKGYREKLDSLFKENFLQTQRRETGFALAVATYEGLVKDIYTESYTAKNGPTGFMDIRITLSPEGSVKECQILNSEVKDTSFLSKLESLIEDKWNFGYGPAKTYQFKYRVHRGMYRTVQTNTVQPVVGLSAMLSGGKGLKRPPLQDRPKPAIMRVVRSHVTGLKMIYNEYREKSPNLAGKVKIKIFINDDGSVSMCQKISSTTGNNSFDTSLMNFIKKWNFGKGKATSIVYPFVFQP